MSIRIALTPEEERTLAELARAHGKDPADHAHDVVIAYLKGVRDVRGDSKSFEEILAPIWEGWQRGGMTHEEIDNLLEQELRTSRRERRQTQGTP